MHHAKPLPKDCRHCGSKSLYAAEVSAGGGYAPNYLPGLGTFWGAAKFTVVVCKECGETRFFAPAEALDKLEEGRKWQRL